MKRPKRRVVVDATVVYRSNNGRGPLHARVLSEYDGMLLMERWQTARGTRTAFEIPAHLVLDNKTGWRRVSQ